MLVKKHPLSFGAVAGPVGMAGVPGAWLVVMVTARGADQSDVEPGLSLACALT